MVQSKFDLNCMLYRYYVTRNNIATITITDAYFPSINPNNIITIASHFQSCQKDQLSIGAYNVATNFFKDYEVEFCISDIEFEHMFGTEIILAKITYELPEAQILAEGSIEETKFGYIYLKKKINQKEFFRALDKHLVPSKILQKFNANTTKSDAAEHMKNKFIT